MDRRHFLLTLLCGLTAATAPQARTRLPDAVCRTRPPEAMPVSLPPPMPGLLRYQGTHILTHGAFRQLAEAYRGPRGERVWVAGGGCDDGITGVRRGLAELGGLCCPVRGSRAEGLPSLLVARDIKVVITHPTNPVREISMQALRDIARGRLGRWSLLGGEDRAIALIVRKHCPEYFEPVRELLVGHQGGWSPRGLFVERDEQITDLVSRFEAALGIVSWVFAKPGVESGKLQLLAVNGVRPSAAAVRSGRYPLHGPLSVVWREWRPEMRPWFDFLYGPRGQAIVARTLVPVSAEEAGYRPFAWT